MIILYSTYMYIHVHILLGGTYPLNILTTRQWRSSGNVRDDQALPRIHLGTGSLPSQCSVTVATFKQDWMGKSQEPKHITDLQDPHIFKEKTHGFPVIFSQPTHRNKCQWCTSASLVGPIIGRPQHYSHRMVHQRIVCIKTFQHET